MFILKFICEIFCLVFFFFKFIVVYTIQTLKAMGVMSNYQNDGGKIENHFCSWARRH